ncbi:MAG: hypothetical protein M1825_004948 [Sarcosagium campestre]|nr:MAG: hypothetical protein M1825_004948 [Sarcosagium campestre]
MLPTSDACDDGCMMAVRRGFHAYPAATVLSSILPFALTFIVVGTVVLQRLFPVLSGVSQARLSKDLSPPPTPQFALRPPPANALRSVPSWKPSLRSWPGTQQLAAITFSTTIALAAVLAELILCEISNSLNPAARTLALQLTVTALLILLIVITPLLELHSVISSAGWDFNYGGRRWLRLPWLLLTLGFMVWAMAFWWIGQGLPGTHVHDASTDSAATLSEACLERVGVIGISLMALLSGFASVSSPWQNFGVKNKIISEGDVTRKQAGLDATNEMLAAKQSRLRILERKMSETPQEGFMTRFMGSIRGNADTQERSSLQLEISGLEAMRSSLTSSVGILRGRLHNQQRSSTPSGRFLLLASYVFSLYCLYRILATSMAALRRWWYPDTSFAGTDPINNLLALVAKHWDPSLDRLAWSRQISFLLSGVILLASFSSVLQTVHFFSRFAPTLLQHTQANLALLVGQISATYVISSALLLRSNLPREVGSVISEALGAPLDSAFVDRWFEGWFLTASGLTAVGIVLGRKLGGAGEWDDDDDDDLEMGSKRS